MLMELQAADVVIDLIETDFTHGVLNFSSTTISNKHEQNKLFITLSTLSGMGVCDCAGCASSLGSLHVVVRV